jgi:hypothetical protein
MLPGLSLATCQTNYNTYSIAVCNQQSCINDAAHLYNCIKSQDLLGHGWPKMDQYLKMHGKHHFGNTRPATLHQCYIMYQVGQGLSIAQITGMSHQRGFYGAWDPEKVRRAKYKAPLRKHFEENSSWPEGVDSAGLARILELKRKNNGNSDGSSTDGETNTDKYEESTPVDVELLRTFRKEIEKEHKALTFDYLTFHEKCKGYLLLIKGNMSSKLPSAEESFIPGELGVVRIAYKVLDVLDRYSAEPAVSAAMLRVLKEVTEQQT